MVEMLNKLEFMLMGLRQMNVNAVCAWFPKIAKEDIIKAIEESPKFKVEGNVVSLKSETELYEEELQKDILKDLMGEMNESSDDDDDLSGYDDDLELVEAVEESPINLDDEVILVDIQEDPIVEEIDNEIVESQWVEAKEAAEEVAPIETIETSHVEEVVSKSNDEYFDYYYNNNSSQTKQEVSQKLEEKVVEKVVEKVIEITDVSKVKGSDIPYEDLIRLIDEYNEEVESKLNYALENKFEVRVKAIKSFYENKYVVKVKEENILDTQACIFALVHKKKGMEVAYLVVCELLNEVILNYMLDHYDDEVVYFCPVEGSEVNFEVGLNEFYLKDTSVIFDKFLEHYVVIEECDVKVKNLEVIIGSN
ncbi:hypothetical protein [Clostridium sp. LP20]|uniref:hypothetical protein n=1 Tax=Clostridium sp. LP20 TaxID=3418665 RepID=UPI003EE50138